MGGDYGGADCVHVIDVRAEVPTSPLDRHRAHQLNSDTDVIIHDEHGNVCQFTYQEWWDFAEKVADWQYAEIGKDARAAMAPVDRCTCHETGSPCVCTGMDPSAMAQLDALPSVSVEISGTFDMAESGEKTVALGTFIPHTAEATGTPELLRAVADELERRDAVPHIADGAHADYLADPAEGRPEAQCNCDGRWHPIGESESCVLAGWQD